MGTNTVLLVVAERRAEGAAEGALEIVEDVERIPRLGRGLDTARVLHPVAIEDTLAAIDELARIARAAGAEVVRAVGTSALRDAVNAGAFLARAGALLDGELEVVSGAREAELAFRGALAVDALDDGPVVVVDIGGGSTEVIHGRVRAGQGEIDRAVSLTLGSVRHYERHLASDPPTAAELAALHSSIAAELSGVGLETAGRIVGVGATFTTLAAVVGAPDRLVTREAVEAWNARLSASSTADRRALPGMAAGRADVFAVGVAIVLGVLARAPALGFLPSRGGVRTGLAAELLKKEPENRAVPR